MIKRLLVTTILLSILSPGFASAIDKLTGIHSARVMSQSLPWMAEEAGLFKKYNLDYEQVFVSSSSIVTAALLGGDAEMTLTGGIGNVSAYVRGTTDVVFVAGVKNVMTQSVVAGKAIKRPEDLKGKKIGNFSRVTGAYFFSAVIAKEHGLDIEKDFQSIPAETGALIALLERGEVEAINMFEPHVTKLVVSGRYRVLMDFDKELKRIFGAPPLKTGMAVLKDSVGKQAALINSIRGAYVDGIKLIKAGKDEAFFKAHAKEFFNLTTPEEIAAGIKSSRENFADVGGDAFFKAQNKILQTGISLGLLPNVGNLNDLWVK